MKLYFLPAALIAGLGIAGAASALEPGAVSTKPGHVLDIGTEKGTVRVTPLSSDIFRVTVLPENEQATPYFESQSAIMTPDTLAIRRMNHIVWPDRVELSGLTTKVVVDRKTGNVSFYSTDGEELLTEIDGVDNNSATKSVSFSGIGAGNLYGAGERGHSLRLNGDSLSMYNRQNYGYTKGDPRISQMGISVPYFASDRGFGVLFDDYDAAALRLGKDTILYTSPTPRAISYYFINSKDKNLAGVAKNYSRLTGYQPLPPLWSLGYITSKYGYHNQQEALGVVDSIKSAGYPLDGIVLDLYWYGKETDMGRLEWNPEQWPNHREMLDSLKNQGVKMVVISQPYINKIGAIDNYNYLAEQGMLTKDAGGNVHDVTTWVGDAGMFDVSNPATRQWLQNRLMDLTQDGLAGWWGDLGEPEVHPQTIVHDNGQTAAQYHNVYGNEWSKLIYDGLRENFPEMRPLLMMRGGTAGLQRYAVAPWTTDVSRSWGGFGPQINLMLNSGLSGLGYMSSDIGGFAVDPKNPTDPELYVRWLQMGTFTPMLRTHATVKPEPYHYPQQESIIKKFIKMRYEWLPYNYTLAAINAVSGQPLALPINYDGKSKGDAFANVQDEYMWGPEVLVAPVMEKGAKSRKVLFPEGEWINWWNPALKYKGGKSYTVAAPLDQMPLFVKAGSFIPQYTREIENTDQYDASVLTVKYFPSTEKTSYNLFDDDHKSPESIKKGECAWIMFQGQHKGTETNIEISTTGGYLGMPETRMFDLQIVGVAAPKSVEWNDVSLDKMASRKMIRQYGYTYDAATRTLTIVIPYNHDYASIKVK
ncbi:MAG: DUF5110 domain-containing protein [Bacteroides sp.]|nr:DUF5110 domain-containing protein [Bacteroides sp.]